MTHAMLKKLYKIDEMIMIIINFEMIVGESMKYCSIHRRHEELLKGP
jgi:hypothetical protein